MWGKEMFRHTRTHPQAEHGLRSVRPHCWEQLWLSPCSRDLVCGDTWVGRGSHSLHSQSTGECAHQTGVWSGAQQAALPQLGVCPWSLGVDWLGLGTSPQQRGIMEMRDSEPKYLP